MDSSCSDRVPTFGTFARADRANVPNVADVESADAIEVRTHRSAPLVRVR